MLGKLKPLWQENIIYSALTINLAPNTLNIPYTTVHELLQAI